MSKYCHSCGNLLEPSPTGLVTAVKSQQPGAGHIPFDGPPVRFHAECFDRLESIGIRYRRVEDELDSSVTNPASPPSPP